MNFQAETVSFCDLTCSECPNWMMKRKRHLMSPEIWDTILRKYVVPYHRLNEHLGPPTLIPHKDGEPLLNKNLPSFLKSASDLLPELRINIYSHGLLLKHSFLDFLWSLPNKVTLLISFHFHNHDGTYNDYKKTTDLLQTVFSGRKVTDQNVEFVLTSHLIAPMTSARLLEWKEMWRPWIDEGKVTVHANVSINPWTGLMKDVATCQHHGCPYSEFGHMFFGATGNVIACCMDLEEEIVFGNVLKDDPEEMVAKVREFYAAQKHGKPLYSVCNDCYGLPREEKQGLLQLGGVA